jgi:hypothetical protein
MVPLPTTKLYRDEIISCSMENINYITGLNNIGKVYMISRELLPETVGMVQVLSSLYIQRHIYIIRIAFFSPLLHTKVSVNKNLE